MQKVLSLPIDLLSWVGNFHKDMSDVHGTKFLGVFKVLCAEIFFLITLGAGVRAMNAGLACPDWPLCFGDYIPDYHPQVYFEFIHRVLAGMVALTSTYLSYHLMKSNVRSYLKYLAGANILLLIAQVILGGLTVLWQLHEKVVTAHLLMGATLLGIHLWIFLTLKENKRKEAVRSRWVANAAVALIFLVMGQIALGGLVASHYAGNVCPSFPLCHGQFFPTFMGSIGLQVMHRLGAYILTIFIVAFVVMIFKSKNAKSFSGLARTLLAVFLCQFVIGIANVIFTTPPLITVLHSAFAMLILGSAIALLRKSTAQS